MKKGDLFFKHISGENAREEDLKLKDNANTRTKRC